MKSKVKEYFATSFSGGVMGPPGWSAYELAVANGFEGSVEEWLDSLEGPPGPAPELGVDYFTEADRKKIVEDLLSTEAVTAMQEDIRKIKEDLAYVPIDVSGIRKNVASQLELGTRIYTVTVAWDLNKTPVKQTFNGSEIGPEVREITVNFEEGLTSYKKFTVIAEDERGASDPASTDISFLRSIYFGALDADGILDSAAILSMNHKLSGSPSVSFTVTPEAGQKLAYAQPSAYRDPKFNIGGFDYVWTKAAADVQHTNASGHTESYDIWMNDDYSTGEKKVVVS